MSNSFRPHDYAEELKKTGDYAQEDKVLYQWSGIYWRALSDAESEEHAYSWLEKNRYDFTSSGNARKAVAAAVLWCGKLPPIPRDVIIPCRNGYLFAVDGRTELRDADKTLGLRHTVNCDFDTERKIPRRFLQFIETILPDADVRARVQEYIGYTLTADARFQLAQLWIGSGANGKGVLANIVQELHGKPECVHLDALEGFGMSMLVGASLIYSDEIPKGRIDEQRLKSLIAGERVQVDRKYKDPVSIRVRGKWLVLGNHMPNVADQSAGFWRRWDIVPFGVTIPEGARDPLLKDKIVDEELSGVLNWALDGLMRLQARGAFDATLPKAMAQVMHDAKAETNSVLAWSDDCGVVASDTNCLVKDAVFANYSGWCLRQGLKAVPAPQFWQRMKTMLSFEEGRVRRGKEQPRVCYLVVPGVASICG
jgi:putative DNA primase/helicase